MRNQCSYPEMKPLSAYTYGCRCEDCRAHHRDYHRRYRQRNPEKSKRKPVARVHGPKLPRVNRGYVYWKGYSNHPLASKNGEITAHRYVMFWKLGGLLPARCGLCARPFGSWSDVDVHHLDHDRLNNDPGNLVARCRTCNRSENRWRSSDMPLWFERPRSCRVCGGPVQSRGNARRRKDGSIRYHPRCSSCIANKLYEPSDRLSAEGLR